MALGTSLSLVALVIVSQSHTMSRGAMDAKLRVFLCYVVLVNFTFGFFFMSLFKPVPILVLCNIKFTFRGENFKPLEKVSTSQPRNNGNLLSYDIR